MADTNVSDISNTDIKVEDQEKKEEKEEVKEEKPERIKVDLIRAKKLTPASLAKGRFMDILDMKRFYEATLADTVRLEESEIAQCEYQKHQLNIFEEKLHERVGEIHAQREEYTEIVAYLGTVLDKLPEGALEIKPIEVPKANIVAFVGKKKESSTIQQPTEMDYLMGEFNREYDPKKAVWPVGSKKQTKPFKKFLKDKGKAHLIED